MSLDSGSENNPITDNSVASASLRLSEDSTTAQHLDLRTTTTSTQDLSILDPDDSDPFQLVDTGRDGVQLAMFGGQDVPPPRTPDEKPADKPAEKPAAPAPVAASDAATATREQMALNQFFARDFLMPRGVDTSGDRALDKKELETAAADAKATPERRALAQFLVDNFDDIANLGNIARKVETPPTIDGRDWGELMRRYQFQRSGGTVPVQRGGENLNSPSVITPLNGVFNRLPAQTTPGRTAPPPSTQPERPPTPPRK